MLTTTIIGDRISAARKQKNLTQTDFARKVNVTSQAVGKWERGESMPDILMFNRIAEVLGVDLNYFSENFESKPVEPKIGTEEEKAFTPKPMWDMSGCMWTDADFSNLTNLASKFSGSNIKGCKFVSSEMKEINLSGSYVDKNDFSNADLSKSAFNGTYLKQNIFNEAKFIETNFVGTHILDNDLSYADFTSAIFKGSSLQKCKTNNTIWDKTSFIDSGLTEMILEGEIKDCVFSNCSYSRTTFQNVILTNTFFKGQTKKIKFINCKADSITYAFLKNGKADMSEIELV